MSDALAHLEPRSIWGHFASIAAIPRPSKHEQKIAAWIRSLAAEHGFQVRSDDFGNLIVDVPATAGLESAPIVIIQSHLDMVCEKDKATEHDFFTDPIVPRIDGEWVYATGTTLGADNGLGVAAGLAAATDRSVKHGPLQLLFTLDEETGLNGAAQVDPSMLHGRILLNLDSEDDGVLCVGCAGGADSHLLLDPRRCAANDGSRAYTLEITGLRGGHSGTDIHENRGNALKLLARALSAGIDAGIDLELADLRGGSMRNAIPREAEAALRLPADGVGSFEGVLAGMLEKFRIELHGIDDGLDVQFEQAEPAGDVLVREDRDRLLRLLMAVPHGPLAMSPDIPGLVETSSCLAVVEAHEGNIRIVASSRSSVDSQMEAVLASIRAVGKLAGVHVRSFDGYPGWKPDLDSRLLEAVRKVYAKVWSKPPLVQAVHAGLECGLLGRKLPELEMISFGPQIEGPHSPNERVSIPSVARFWEAFRLVLEKLATAS